jgi:hypothetical protein
MSRLPSLAGTSNVEGVHQAGHAAGGGGGADLEVAGQRLAH